MTVCFKCGHKFKGESLICGDCSTENMKAQKKEIKPIRHGVLDMIAKKISELLRDLEKIDPIKYPKTLTDVFKQNCDRYHVNLKMVIEDIKTRRFEFFKIQPDINPEDILALKIYELSLVDEIRNLKALFRETS